jgi:superfamily II DNA or RNA helicase
MPHATIAPGAQIEVRDAVWRVQRVDTTSTGRQAWRCVGVSEIVRDQEAIFLEEYEPEVRVLDPRQTQLVRDTSSQHRAGLLSIESMLRDVPPPDDGLYVGHKAAMDLLDFQLDPAWMALQQPRQRILIADSVGLGKTLEAGILLSELIRRKRARRILVATTKSMLTQFQKELWARFTIPLVRLDSVGLARIRRDIPSHHNPFYFFDKTIISIDTLKQNNWFRTHVEKAYWDVIVIDEAHNVATRGARSQRATIADVLARNCDSLIMLSATPHDGRAESFASLMNMLDPTAIADPKNYTKDDIEGLYVRRFKHDVKDQLAQAIPERLPPREARAQATPAEEAAFDVLTALHLPTLDPSGTGDILVKTGLTKALFSSPRACLDQLRAPLRRSAVRAQLPEAVRNAVRDTTTPTSTLLTRASNAVNDQDMAADLRALADLAAAVEAIAPDQFSKYQTLLTTIADMGWKARSAKEDRLVIFTERRETLGFLEEQLPTALALKAGQLEVLHGGLPDVEQQRIVEDFGNASSKMRLLLASDVASEGLNLHYLSHRLIHFDIPWSLMVFQQRNGRIDRYGQKKPPQIVYMRTDSANESIRGDNRILDVLREKEQQAYDNIGDPGLFMGVFDVETEERKTAQAMQDDIPAEQLSAELDRTLKDPFALMLGDAGAAATATPAPTRAPASLFENEFDYLATGIEHLQAEQPLRATINRDSRLVELTLPPDLKRRFTKLPKEVLPTDGVALLTADTQRMQRALDEARREEHAWPAHQLLWANSPVVAWLADRARAFFGRHTAPILTVPQLGDADRSAVLVSGLLPNRRGQPLVHRWYAVHFQRGTLDRVESFDEFQASTRLGRHPLPNAGSTADEKALATLLPPAIDATRRRLEGDRDRFRADQGPRLTRELERLARLEGAQLAFVDSLFKDRNDSLSGHQRSQRQRRIRSLFQDYKHWIEQSMTAADEPFLQVVAVLIGGSA